LRRSADNAMYRAKQDRKGSAQFFTAAMGEALTARMEMEQRLRLALRERRFATLLQPKVSLSEGTLVGFEALVRGAPMAR
jgi:predicted signal transduction protein with EAL and GGDEF domain